MKAALEVCCAAERRYAPHSAAMLHSVIVNAGTHPVRVHYLVGPAFPRRATRRIGRMVEALGATIAFIEVARERIARLPDPRGFTEAMWYRLLLPELAPDVERMLYLDVDTIALDDLSPLWETDLGANLVAAATNVFEQRFRHRPRALGLSGPEAYFNSGVMLLDLSAMRAAGAQEAIVECASARPDLLWPDQDALNVVLAGRRLALHPRWNCMNSTLAFESARNVYGADAVARASARPAIRHFEGPFMNKPWHLLCDHPHRERYWEHRHATPWPLPFPTGVSTRNLWRRARGRTGVSA
ncbi:glycosyltransferase family 8 protein [soil metagenome]